MFFQNVSYLQEIVFLLQAAQQHVEKTMTDMLEQKNKLAYDKGRLQSKVDQLQRDLESLANAQTELVQSKKLNASLEVKYHEVSS